MQIDYIIPIMDLIEALATVFSAFFIVIELRKSANTATGEFVLNLQDQYVSNEKYAELFEMCWGYYKQRTTSKELKDYLEENRETLLNYLTFFESVYLIKNKKVIGMDLLDDLFGRRFLIVVNNRIVQDFDLVKHAPYYENIFRLYNDWRQFRKSKIGVQGELLHNLFIDDADRYRELCDAI